MHLTPARHSSAALRGVVELWTKRDVSRNRRRNLMQRQSPLTLGCWANGIPVISEAEEQTPQSKKARSRRRRIILPL
jgi:hypothetical protein